MDRLVPGLVIRPRQSGLVMGKASGQFALGQLANADIQLGTERFSARRGCGPESRYRVIDQHQRHHRSAKLLPRGIAIRPRTHRLAETNRGFDGPSQRKMGAAQVVMCILVIRLPLDGRLEGVHRLLQPVQPAERCPRLLWACTGSARRSVVSKQPINSSGPFIDSSVRPRLLCAGAKSGARPSARR